MEFLNVAIQAARRGGEILQDWAGRFSVKEKSRANLVTEADFASQEAIHSIIQQQCPTHSFLGEEGLAQTNERSAYRWIIDPLDGTSNYVHGFPYYAVSIALEYQRELILGVIFDPSRDELFTACAGQGAKLNGRPLQTSGFDDLSQCFCVASLPIAAGRTNPAVLRFLQVMEHAQTVQRTGSAALNLAYVAAGRIDAFWSTSLKPWDMAAGVVLVREAGGEVSRINGDSFAVDVPDVLATNSLPVQSQLVRLLAEAA